MGQEEDTEGPKPVGPEVLPAASLTAAREQAGLSLLQAADRLHLDVSAVKALEAGRFEVLGAAVHVRGHLRRYADLLGLPAQDVEKSFLQSHPARSTPDLRHGAGLLQKSDAGKRALRPGTAALGALVIVIIGVVLWARRVQHRGRSRAGRRSARRPRIPRQHRVRRRPLCQPVVRSCPRKRLMPRRGSMASPRRCGMDRPHMQRAGVQPPSHRRARTARVPRTHQ
jgi:transcriptional regulator with XRE-family HTH domain